MRLGDVFAERSERASGNELLLAVTINNGVIKRSDIELKNNSSEDKSNYKKVRIGDIAYNTMRMWQGASGTSLFDGIVSPAYTIVYLRNANENNIGFWAYYFKHIPLIQAFQKSSQGLTSDTWNLKYPQFAQIQVYVPSYAEQCRIYRILTAYDNCILANENLSNSLEKYKYTLLSQMFI